ncbi:MAG: hypothetical protein COA84_13020 [Robiginitomaculum sp.]|nr:MAG: hypothetical protein COA84_13020 [Robiginitomaculum sp.]
MQNNFNHVDHGFVLPELECITTPKMRTYTTPLGYKYPSVTTVLGADESKKEGLDKWRQRIGPEEADKIMRQAGIRGNAVHEMAEKFLNNDITWKKGAMPSNLLTFSQIKKVLIESVDNVWEQEVPLYSDRLKVAGRVDCIAEFNGKLSIIDFKTSLRQKRKEWISGYFMQTGFYAAAFYEQTGIAIKNGVIIIASDDSTSADVFEINTFEYLPEFIKLRQLFRSIHYI